jgi:hypothetical protein
MAPVAEQKCVQNRIRSFIILDLETTGLPHDKPVKITEITMVAALREHIVGYENDTTKGDALPRVLSKLTICVCPRRTISQRASDITRMLIFRLYLSFVTELMKMTAFWDIVTWSIIEAVSTSETSVYQYETTWHNNPEGCHLHTHRRENQKSH